MAYVLTIFKYAIAKAIRINKTEVEKMTNTYSCMDRKQNNLCIAIATCIKTTQNPKSRGGAERRLYFSGFIS